jgi:CRISPR type III-B/RAMP module RAMP protein Cmr6
MAHNHLLSRRELLPDYSQAHHPGLLLERGLSLIKKSDASGTALANKTVGDKEPPAVNALIEKSCEIKVADYSSWFSDWQSSLVRFGARCFQATTTGRMVVGLGNESVLETAISLHRIYGVPFIPGSALKGLASSYARQRLQGWDHSGDAYKILFGDTTTAGYVTFWDALAIQHQLHPDIITVHHPEYYGSGDKPPADWDDPTPIPFISASGSFLIALSGPAEWIKTAHGILKLALEEYGIGAKTSSGYGRMVLNEAKYIHPNIQEPKSVSANPISPDVYTGPIALPATTPEQMTLRGKIFSQTQTGDFRVGFGNGQVGEVAMNQFDGVPRGGLEIQYSEVPTLENIKNLRIKVLGKPQ